MLSVMQTALGGLLRNQQGLAMTANNIANVNTDGYRAQRVERGGSEAAPAVEVAADSQGYSDVDLAAEIVHLKTYEVGYEANARVLSVSDRLLGELMDLLC
jgi:flagellar hook protein FlgE